MSPVNWPFSRVGVSRKTSSDEEMPERCISSKTASSVSLSESNVARRFRGAALCWTTAEIFGVSPAPGGRICR